MTLYEHRKAILLFILAKLLIIMLFPLSGDEAYFLQWGKTLEAGYYDHPPMAGWFVYLFSFISDRYLFFRLLAFGVTVVVAWGLYDIGRRYADDARARFVALLFFLSPPSLLMAVYTNDTVLLLFGTLAAVAFVRALHSERGAWFALLAGLLFGLAFLSKYFAVFLGAGLIVFAVVRHGMKGLRYSLIAVAAALPFIFQNLWFNYESCWNNILFNFFARTEESRFHLSTVFFFLALVLYLLTPWGAYLLAKKRRDLQNREFNSLLFWVLAIPFAIFFYVSFKNKVGLHWFLLFAPYIYLLFHLLGDEALRKMYRYNVLFTFGHIAILLVLLLIPVSWLQGHKKYNQILMFTSPELICEQLPKDEALYTFGYTTASVLGYHCDRTFHVLFSDSKYGRQDDKWLDVRTLNDQNLTFVGKKDYTKRLEPYFKQIKVTPLPLDTAFYYLTQGEGFDYERYRSDYLKRQQEHYYAIPEWLPCGQCYFRERYGL